MKSRADFLQDIVRKYLDAGHATPANPKDIARWAIQNSLWAPRPDAVVNQCADQLARAMAQDYRRSSFANSQRVARCVSV